MSLLCTDVDENALFAPRANNGDCLLCPKAPSMLREKHSILMRRVDRAGCPHYSPRPLSRAALFSGDRVASRPRPSSPSQAQHGCDNPRLRSL
jgi:hypothetical protein